MPLKLSVISNGQEVFVKRTAAPSPPSHCSPASTDNTSNPSSARDDTRNAFELLLLSVCGSPKGTGALPPPAPGPEPVTSLLASAARIDASISLGTSSSMSEGAPGATNRTSTSSSART